MVNVSSLIIKEGGGKHDFKLFYLKTQILK